VEASRQQAIRRVLVATLVLNLAVALAKVFAGRAFHLLSLTADGLHSSVDGLNNVVALLAIHFAARPPDAGHPYGHRKLESFAALGIGVSLGLVGAGVVREAISRMGGGGAPVEAHPIAFVVAGVTLVVNFGVWRWESAQGRALGSELLRSDAQHTRGDLLVTLGVLAALTATRWHVPVVDVICALGIGVLIAVAAVRIILRNANVLADAVAVEASRVEQVASAVEGVLACHAVRSRGIGGHAFIDLHVQVDPAMSTAESHDLGHRVANALTEKLGGVSEVLVHVEPYGRTCS
jgi:cation diffusion facilitator family transporter